MKLFLPQWALIFTMAYAMELEPYVPKPLPTPDPALISRFRLAVDSVLGMGIRLQGILNDDSSENFLVSPISATVVVGQLILGTSDPFRKELIDLLALPNSQLYEGELYNSHSPKRKSNSSYPLPYLSLHLQLSSLLKALLGRHSSLARDFVLKLNTALFINDQLLLNNRFKGHLKKFYLTEIRSLNFNEEPVQSQKTINQWASVNTNGLIDSILPSPPSPRTASVFANAVYFKADWEVPFSDFLNRDGPFNVSASQHVNVTYMMGFIEQIPYSESESGDYRMIALPYKNEELGMYILMPNSKGKYRYDIKGFVQSLKTSEILDTITKAKRRDVIVKIPKMTVSHSFSILDELKKYRAFKKQQYQQQQQQQQENSMPNVNHRASYDDENNSTIIRNATIVNKVDKRVEEFKNFTATDLPDDIVLTNATTTKQGLRINDIVQQIVISINEKGTEAAAVTASTIDYIGGSKNFIIESPFVFFIRHEATSTTLFWGTISNPTA